VKEAAELQRTPWRRRPFSSLNIGIESSPAGAAYGDFSLSVEKSVDDLLSHMAVEERIGQTLQVARDYLAREADICRPDAPCPKAPRKSLFSRGASALIFS
jgi:hypothetical protein